jgi:hypothetical protein
MCFCALKLAPTAVELALILIKSNWVQLSYYMHSTFILLSLTLLCFLSITEMMAMGICRADYATSLYQQKLALTSPTSGGRWVGMVRSRTKATQLYVVISVIISIMYYVLLLLFAL